jgi:aminoglycoside phosphotransferase (APT) family kinase protein
VSDEDRVQGLIDAEQLARWMDERDLPGKGLPVEARFISGGASNEIFEIRRGDVRLALRRPPRKVPKGRNETMLREYRVLAALRGTDVPHTRVLAANDDPAFMGACFYLMEYVDGWSCMNLDGWPPPFDADLEARKGLAYELVDAIAKLAQVDWRARGLEGFGKPEGFHERQVDRWLAHLKGFQFREIPGLDVAAEWLRGRTPRSYEPGIIHGDYQFANVMYRHGAPAELAAIIDWEMTTIGDPLLDLGWVLVAWGPEADDMEHGRYVDLAGMPSRDEMLAHYERFSGRSTEDIDYYVVLARFKLGIVLEQSYSRFLAGAAVNPKVEAFGPLVAELIRKAASLAATIP